MGGIHEDKIIDMIQLKDTDEYVVEAMVAIGQYDKYNGSNESVSGRHEVNQFVTEGVFEEKIYQRPKPNLYEIYNIQTRTSGLEGLDSFQIKRDASETTETCQQNF